MLRYLRFIFRIYTSRLGKDLSLPYIQILMSIVGSLCFFYFHLISFSFVVSKFSFTGWSVGEMYILFFTFEIFTYLAFYLYWKGFLETVRHINTGQFDIVLAKPASSWLITFFRGGGLHNILAAVLGSIYLIIVIHNYSLPVSILSICLYIFSMSLSLIFLLCFTSIFISLNFIFGNFQASGIGFSFQDLYKYPAQIYPKSWFFILVVTPFSALVTVPATLLISKPFDMSILGIYLGSIIITSIICNLLWRFGLRRYSSASS